jgi:hypothetical protein
MSFKPNRPDAVECPYPDTAVVEAAATRVHKQRLLDKETLHILGDIPLRAFWFGADWQRALTTSLLGAIDLPDLPGTAVYIRPSLRRLCAALEDASQGLWDQTVLVSTTDFQQELLRSPYVQQSCPSQNVTVHEGEYETALAQVGQSPPGLQVVCFDSIDDTTSQVDALTVANYAAGALDATGLFIIGGEVHTDTGRQCVSTTLDSALELFGLEYEQERTLENAISYQAVLIK